MPTALTLMQTPPRQSPRLIAAACRATKAIRPAPSLEVLLASGLGCELLLELNHCARRLLAHSAQATGSG